MADILTVQECLARVMGDVRGVAKTGHNDAQGFNFRGIDAVVNAVGPALREHGVIVLPRLESKEYVGLQSSKGTPMMCCRVTVTYRFVGPGGDYLEAMVPGEAFDAGDKSTAKAMSVAFRTALLQALALPTDELDPDATSYEQTSKTSGLPPDPETGATTAAPTEFGVGTAPPAPVSHNYLSKEDQALLKVEYGSTANAIKAYQATWPNVRRLADITYEMRDKMLDDARVDAGGYR